MSFCTVVERLAKSSHSVFPLILAVTLDLKLKKFDMTWSRHVDHGRYMSASHVFHNVDLKYVDIL